MEDGNGASMLATVGLEEYVDEYLYNRNELLCISYWVRDPASSNWMFQGKLKHPHMVTSGLNGSVEQIQIYTPF
jgi:hypothetical protein